VDGGRWLCSSSFLHQPHRLRSETSTLERMSITKPTEGISFLLGGGAVSDFASDETAFPYRDSRFWIQIFSRWENPLEATEKTAWVVDTLEAVTPYLQSYKGTIPLYVGFLDYNLPRERALLSYFRRNLRWLRKVKKLVDPKNVFHFEQSI